LGRSKESQSFWGDQGIPLCPSTKPPWANLGPGPGEGAEVLISRAYASGSSRSVQSGHSSFCSESSGSCDTDCSPEVIRKRILKRSTERWIGEFKKNGDDKLNES